MNNKKKQKRRLGKSLARRRKESLEVAWRNIFVKAGVLQDKRD
ncbi:MULTISPECIES: DUF3983 domain-containing protein [unclassified Mesobacillus]|nr:MULTISPECIES: DUF3983 domain-containing protein [unclassified Mesobacillus]MCM3122755.1 DUF3983 domain-containing protein [Mesobacillus sp. MER 33]MCM3232719.1 DUF3983 domain-containing protein [Mesobacillus sp. MER 48]